MKVFLRCTLLFAFFQTALVQGLQAQSIMGAEITYTCIAPGQYHVYLTVYADCHGSAPSPEYSVNYSSVQCGVSSSVTLEPIGQPTDITPLCPSQPSACSGGGGAYGVQKYIYYNPMTIPANCGNDWVFSWSSCCRNAAITDLNNPGNQGIYVEACLDNTASPCAQSPVFLNEPTPFYCAGQPVVYNAGATDAQGDSLVYALACPMQNSGSTVSYSAGFSCAAPFTVTGPALAIDAVSGNMTFTPNGAQTGVTAEKISAYRNGHLVSCVERDMEYTILNCTNASPTATGFGGGANYQITIPGCADTCLKILSADPGGAAVTMTWDNGIPGATFTTSGSPDPTGTFCWATSANDTGTHYFSVTVTNNSCPVTGSNTYIYTVHVVPSNDPAVIASPDTTLCPGKPVTLKATVVGATPVAYTWSNGVSNIGNTQNLTITPASTTEYIVTAYYTDGCAKIASVVVNSIPNPNLSVFPGSITLCSGSVNLLASTTAANATYTWSPAAGLSCTNCANPVATPTVSTQYCVSITDSHGCASNTVCSSVTLAGPPPPQTCSVIYATTTGTGTGTKASPTNLQGAILLAQCNNSLIKLAIGTYTINSPISNVTSYTTIEGGFDPVTWTKSSQPGATTIYRSNQNPEGPPNAPRIVAFYFSSENYFRFQDVTIQTQDCPNSTTGVGMSNYVFYLSNCSNYDFVRCQIIPGAGGSGLAGTAGVAGTFGTNGSGGSAGNNDVTPLNAPGGNGGAGAGSFPGAGGGGGQNSAGGSAGIASTDARSGGGGGGGGAGGYGEGSDPNGGNGARGGGVNGAGNGGAGGGGGAVSNIIPEPLPFFVPGEPGTAGTAGAAGAAGAGGTAGSAGAYTLGFYVPGGQGNNGGNGGGGYGGGGGGGGGGQQSGIPGTGNGGGGGGGGGQAGTGGTGGYGGGCSIGVYLYTNGGAGIFDNCNITAGTAGAGGQGGTGGLGGSGGTGGLGNTAGATNQIGHGGNGGKGGNGGQGGQGGSGVAGPGLQIYLDGGTATVQQDISFNLSAEPVIMVTDVNCTMRPVTFSAGASANWDVDVVSNPETGTGATFTSQYSTEGRKNITYSGDIYTGFYNIPINANTYIPTIATTASQLDGDTFILCLGSPANFNAVIPAADTFDWDFGGAIVSNTYTGTQYQNLNNLVFTTAGVFKIKVRISTACCGWSPYDSIYLVVDQPPQLSISGPLSFCPGGSTTLTASGASNYTWSPGAGLNTTTGPVVVANPQLTTTYLVQGSSVYGYCTADTTVTVSVTGPPSLSFTTVAATCGDNGSATVIVAPPGNYTYIWSDPLSQRFQTAINLAAGGYGVTVTNATSNCSAIGDTTVSTGNGIQAFIDSSSNLTCNGVCNGTATVKATGGSGNYSYLWSNNATTRILSGLCANTYLVTVTDVGSTCTAGTTVTISQPQAIVITFGNIVNPVCPGQSNGSAVAESTGGTGPYQFAWNDIHQQDSAHAVNLASGQYTVTVTDQSGCTMINAVSLSTPQPLMADTLQVTDVSCNGLSDGSITLSVNGGLYPYTYNWPQLPLVTDSTPANLAAATYTVYVSDAHQCADTLNITLTQPQPLAATATTDSVKCSGGSTGGALISASGGTVPYQYSTDGINFQTDSALTGLSAGIYTASIKDANGCTATTAFTVYEPVPLSAMIASTDSAKCFGSSDGSATVSISGGTPVYTAVLGGQTLSSLPYIFDSLAAGSYTINVTDANNCTTTVPATIGQPAQLVLTPSGIMAATCFGEHNGSVTVSAAGGNSPYQYTLNGGAPQLSGSFGNVPGGFDVLGVVDNNMCNDTLQINVPQPAQTTFLDTAVTNVSCFGGSNGAVTVSETAGSTNGPWTYLWNNAQTTATIAGLTSGMYSVIVTDINNCSTPDTVFVTQPMALVLSVPQIVNVSCFGLSDGCIIDSASGGTPAYTYTWSNNAGNNPQNCGLPVGSYSLTVTDSQGCVDSSAANLQISQPPVLTLTTVVTPVSCPGRSDGTILAMPEGGSMPYTFKWSNTPENINPDSLLAPGIYSLTVSDTNNCSAAIADTILSMPPLNLVASGSNILCNPLHDGTVAISVQSNFPPVAYLWNTGATSQNLDNLAPGYYSVTATDAHNCTADTAVTLTTDSSLFATITPADTTIHLGDQVDLSVATNGLGGNIANIVWQPAYGLSCANCVAPVAAPIQTTNYIVTITSDSGCVTTEHVNVQVTPLYEVYVPNVFSPNGDGNNDYFQVFGNKGAWEQFSVLIFDRWGEKVFESNDMNFQWDGIYRGAKLPVGVYVYEMNVVYLDGHPDNLYTGSITLLR